MIDLNVVFKNVVITLQIIKREIGNLNNLFP